ncbi:unnamed protein product, partial [marine sediment metagenome]
GYEELFEKLKIKYDKSQSLEKFQEQIDKYVEDTAKTEVKYKIAGFSCISMFTEKDSEMYYERMFDYFIPKMLEEGLDKIENIINENMQIKENN